MPLGDLRTTTEKFRTLTEIFRTLTGIFRTTKENFRSASKILDSDIGLLHTHTTNLRIDKLSLKNVFFSFVIIIIIKKDTINSG